MNTQCHVAPVESDLDHNRNAEPEGERLRDELVAWLHKNKIVSLRLDTPEHCVEVDIVKLPDRIKSVLGLWGSIYVRDDRDAPQGNAVAKPPRRSIILLDAKTE